MKALTSVLMVMVIALFAVTNVNSQDTSNIKVVLHGAKMVNDSSHYGIAGSVVMPNPGAKVVVAVVGPKYSVKDVWSIEFMAGTFSKDNVAEMLFDTRISYDGLKPLHLWSCIEYFPTSGNWYSYIDANYEISNLGLIGIESENMHLNGSDDDLSIGPRVVIPFQDGKFVLIGAYQFHNNDNSNQLWTRTVFNF